MTTKTKTKTKTKTTKTVVDALREGIAGCIAAAREQGYDGEDSEYECTSRDEEWILEHEAAGMQPTREEWEEARRSFR